MLVPPCVQVTTALFAPAVAAPPVAGKQAGWASYTTSSIFAVTHDPVVRIATCLNPVGTTGKGTVYSSQLSVSGMVETSANDDGFAGDASTPTWMLIVDHVKAFLARNRI